MVEEVRTDLQRVVRDISLDIEDVRANLSLTLKEFAGSHQQLGLVLDSPLITSGSEDDLQSNIQKLHALTDIIEIQHEFPVFSIADVLPPVVLSRISEHPDRLNIESDFLLDVLGTGVITDIFVSSDLQDSLQYKELYIASTVHNIKVHYWDDTI